MQASFAQEFNETAAAAYEAFPLELARLVVVVDKLVYISPEIAGQLTKNTSAIREALAKATSERRTRNWQGIAWGDFDLAGTPVDLIALTNKNIGGTFSRLYTKKMAAIYNLDHEIGHHIVKGGMAYSEHLSENAADAYAMLRHIQRFGKNTGHAGNKGADMASPLVLFADTAHYTTNAIQRAIEVADEKGEDFFTLSLRETAELAAEIADECQLNRTTLKKLRKAFMPVAKYCKANIGDAGDINRKLYDEDKETYAAVCRKTISAMRKYQGNPAVFKAGEHFLSQPKISSFMTEAAKTDSYWKNALAFLNRPKQSTLTRGAPIVSTI